MGIGPARRYGAPGLVMIPNKWELGSSWLHPGGNRFIAGNLMAATAPVLCNLHILFYFGLLYATAHFLCLDRRTLLVLVVSSVIGSNF